MATLTEMLNNAIFHAEDVLVSTGNSEKDQILYAQLLRDTFKEWLKTVGLPDYFGYGKDRYRFNITESLRQLLIMLVDEP